MADSTEPPQSGEVAGLRALYDATLGPYLAAQDARVRAARRNRWIVLVAGLSLAALILAWAVRSEMGNDFVPMLGLGIAGCAVAYFWLVTADVADDVRHQLMGQIAPLLDLRYEQRAAGFDLDRFALLGLAVFDKITRSDRLTGTAGGLAMDMMAVRLADVSTSGIGDNRQTRTVERFSGLLLRITDPVPPAVRFRLVPPAGGSRSGMLRDITVVSHTSSAGGPALAMAEARKMLAAGPESAPAVPTGDAEFDARFELHALASDVPAALARLDAGTRGALLDAAASFDGGPVSVGFDRGDILLAFMTDRRFEIGALRPPMAQFDRVEHLAEQMGILATIARQLAMARGTAAA